MAMFVVKSIHIQINSQVMDLSIACLICNLIFFVLSWRYFYSSMTDDNSCNFAGRMQCCHPQKEWHLQNICTYTFSLIIYRLGRAFIVTISSSYTIGSTSSLDLASTPLLRSFIKLSASSMTYDFCSPYQHYVWQEQVKKWKQEIFLMHIT